MIRPRALVVAWAVGCGLVAVAACGFGEVALEGKACDAAGRCSQGFACDRPSNVCIRVRGGLATLPDGAVVQVDDRGEITGPQNNADGGLPPNGEGGSPPANDSGTDVTTLPAAFDAEDAGVAVRLNAVAVSNTYAVAVGESGTVVRRSARASWQKIDVNTKVELLGVAASGDDVYAVGRSGVILRSTTGGTTFVVESKWTSDFYGVALVQNKVRIVGAQSSFLGADIGASLGPMAGFSPTPGGPWTFTAIWAPSDADSHLVSLEGLYHHFTAAGASSNSGTKLGGGVSFLSVGGVDATSPPLAISHGDVYTIANGYTKANLTNAELRALFVKSSSQMYAVGDVGTAFRYLSTTPGWEPLGTGTMADLRGIHGSGSLTIAVGANGTVLVLK